MSENFQEILLKEISQLFRPILLVAESEEARTRLFSSLGWNLQAITGFPISDLQSCLSELANAYAQIDGWIDAPPSTLDQLLKALNTVHGVVQNIEKLHQVLDKPGLTKPEGFEKLAEDLIEHLTVHYLAARHPQAYALASMVTVIAEDSGRPSELVIDPVTNFVIRQPAPRPKLHLDRIPKLLQDPVAVLKNEYMPDSLATYADAQAAADRLFPRLATFLATCGSRSNYGLNPAYGISLGSGGDEVAQLSMGVLVPLEPDADSGFGAILAFSPADRGDLGLVISPFGRLAFIETFENWLVDLRLEGGQDGFAVHPRHGVRLPDTTQEAHIAFAVQLTKLANESGAAFLVGSTQSTRLEIGQFAIRGEVNLSANHQDYGFVVEAGSAAFVVSAGDGGGFLQKVLPKDGFRTDFDLAIGWSNRKGLYFRGGAGLETTLLINKELLGVLKIGEVYLALRAKETDIEMVVAATATVKLGPVNAVIERMGLEATFTFPQNGGNLGPANLVLGFKQPDGAGLAIDTGVVVGGGYLFFDKQNQQYAGAVQLEVAELLNLTAFGLITTKMPDGSLGFSLLVLIATRFNPPMQLGYGFTLNGVGGLVGVNRTVSVDVLRMGLRTGTLGSVLFPVDPIRTAAQIISDLASIFPVAEGRFVFGPMAILGWGTPTLLTLELGLVLELPAPVRLFILGRLRVLLPEEQYPVVRLQLDSLGVINFDSGDVALDAVLFDSVVAQYAVTGEMALRANFGKTPGFVLAVGGFHPGFTAPAGFPSLERVAISLATGDNPRLGLSAYLALTTNTIQFGALLDLYAKAGNFSIEGLFGFDALIRVAPFGFVAELGAMVAVKFNKQVLLAAMLEMSLTGPTPWHAWGRASFKVLLIEATVAFNVQIGDEAPPPLPAPVQVRPLLLAALNQPGNWATQLPRGEHPIVVLREQPKETETLVHPLADLQAHQRVVPLRREITRFGNTDPDGERWFDLAVVANTGDDSAKLDAKPETINDLFAPAQFWEMSDDEKLSAPSFVEEQSGIRFSIRGYSCGPDVSEESMGYDETLEFMRTSTPVTPSLTGASGEVPASASVSDTFVERVAGIGAAGRAAFSRTGKARYRTASDVSAQGFGLKPPAYVVVDVDGELKPAVAPAQALTAEAIRGERGLVAAIEAGTGALGYSDAVEAMRSIAVTPEERRRLRVVPSYGWIPS